jgi:hypothetical protein
VKEHGIEAETEMDKEKVKKLLSQDLRELIADVELVNKAGGELNKK